MPDESIIGLLITVQLLSATGALAPGPLFVTNLIYGIRGGWRSGFKVALGHMIVEFPLYMTIGLGLISIMYMANFKIFLGVLGGTVMLIFGTLQIANVLKGKSELASMKLEKHGPLIMGILLSAFNPFFILWWLFIGSTFIYATINILSYYGLPLIYVSHVWMDFVWLSSTAHMAFIGKNILREKYYRFFVGILGLILIVFGVHFISKSVWNISVLPF